MIKMSEEKVDYLIDLIKPTIRNVDQWKYDAKNRLNQSGIIRTEDKDDRVSEEWARKFLHDSHSCTYPEEYYAERIKNLKQNNRIRKTELEEAREKTDEIIETLPNTHTMDKKKLKYYIQAERVAGDKNHDQDNRIYQLARSYLLAGGGNI
jgi:hypothetical protein